MSGGIKTACYVIAVAFVFGCSEAPVKTDNASEPKLVHPYRKQSLTVIVSVSETNIATSGRIQLMMDVHTPEGTDVTFPEVASFVEPFSISDGYIEPQQRLPNGKILHRQVWLLVPSTHGTATLGSMLVSGGSTSLETDPITIQVASILPPDLKDLAIKDIAEPITLLPRQRWQQRLWLFAWGAAVAATLVALMIRLCSRKHPVVVIPPYEAALQALDHLPAEQMARIHELSHILVEYLSRRYQLPIIGKTTREIIPLLLPEELCEHKPGLINFFENSDPVRFSNRVPEGFIESMEQYVREFVEDTKPGEPSCD